MGLDAKSYEAYCTNGFVAGIPVFSAQSVSEIRGEIEALEAQYPNPTDTKDLNQFFRVNGHFCLLYTSPSPRDLSTSRMPSSA